MGNRFVHVELNTTDASKAKKFYGQLFTWQLLGAKIVRDVTEVPGVGSLSIITDPTGATLGLGKPKTP
jgi:predicted enzyme related to lactoylglutathione lyase